MRTLFSFVLCGIVSSMAGCTAVDDFGKFTFGDGGASGGSCNAGCNCIPADVSLGVPAHCYVAPANGATCATSGTAPKLMLSGMYMLDTGANPPAITGPGISGSVPGMLEGNSAVFCVGSLIADGTTTIRVEGPHPVVIAAQSLIQLSGTIRAGGGYASDENGAGGVAGGFGGAAATMSGGGPSGGHGGMPGAGGGGAGNTIAGFAGGSSAVSSNTPGGNMLGNPSVGSGGGGGGTAGGKGGGGGGGGGFLQLSAAYALKLSNAGIDVTGGGGAGGAAANGAVMPGGGGGGGGAAGGIIFLDSPSITVDNGCLSVLGGPGGDGGGATIKGRNTAQRTDCPFSGAPSGPITIGEGGLGGFPSNMPGNAPGQPGTMMGGGGGGLGSFGRVIVRSKMQPTTLPGMIVIPAQPEAYQFIMLP